MSPSGSPVPVTSFPTDTQKFRRLFFLAKQGEGQGEDQSVSALLAITFYIMLDSLQTSSSPCKDLNVPPMWDESLNQLVELLGLLALASPVSQDDVTPHPTLPHPRWISPLFPN